MIMRVVMRMIMRVIMRVIMAGEWELHCQLSPCGLQRARQTALVKLLLGRLSD